MRPSVVVRAFLVVVASFLASCGDQIEDAVREIDLAISAINQDSASWQNQLQQLVTKMPAEYRAQAELLAGHATAGVAESFKCSVDFLADRAKSSLLQFRAQITHTSMLGQLPPAVCTITPTVIDLNLNPKNWWTIAIDGYDLDEPDADGHLMGAVLEAKNGKVIPIPDACINRTTHYLTTINLGGGLPEAMQSAGAYRLKTVWKLPKEEAPKFQPLSLAWWRAWWYGLWNKAKVIGPPGIIAPDREIAIVQWRPSTDPIIVPVSGEPPLYPAHIHGDDEFATHDDHTMTYSAIADLRLSPDGHSIEGDIQMRADENKGDFTEAQKESGWHAVWTAPDGATITGFSPKGRAEVHGYIAKTPITTKFNEATGAERFVAYGDHDGNDVGSYTHLEVTWHQLSVSVTGLQPTWARAQYKDNYDCREPLVQLEQASG